MSEQDKLESWGDFSWGRVIGDHKVGPYTIRAYHPRITGNSAGCNAGVTEYHGYIDNKSVGESWTTLDDALAGLIVRRALGANSNDINYHFMAGIRAMAHHNNT